MKAILRVADIRFRSFLRKFSALLLHFSDHRITRSPDHPILMHVNLRSSAKICGQFSGGSATLCLRGDIWFLVVTSLRCASMLLVFCIPAMSQQVPSTSNSSSMTSEPRSQLCITEGEINQLDGNKLSVSVPKMRAFVTDPTLQEVEAHFKYLGRSTKTIPLASGQVRRQFGLKLRAQNGCNLVYAMWRIRPVQELVVSVKSNPGMSKSAECDAHGYHNIKPTAQNPMPQIQIGKAYTLRAIMDGSKMRVYVNNKLVWEGDLGPEALAFDGPVGVRTDNGHFEFELFAAKPGAGQHGATSACQGQAEEE